MVGNLCIVLSYLLSLLIVSSLVILKIEIFSWEMGICIEAQKDTYKIKVIQKYQLKKYVNNIIKIADQ